MVRKSGAVLIAAGGFPTGSAKPDSRTEPAFDAFAAPPSQPGRQPHPLINRPLGVQLGGDVGASDDVDARAAA